MITRALHYIATLLLATAFITPRLALAAEPVWVRGYVRPSSGTYVAPHFRSAPDGNFYNNWSTKGNINPFTGAAGTRVTPLPNYGGNGSYGAYGTGNAFSIPIGLEQRTAVEARNRHRIAKELYETATMDTLGATLAAKLERAKRIGFRTRPKVLVRDGRTILLGEVTTEHDCVIAELFLRLEPTVSEVDNLLIVASTAASATIPATVQGASNAGETPTLQEHSP